MKPIELRSRRARLGIAQADLAVLLDVKQVTVSRWESGTSPVPVGAQVALGMIEDAFDDLVDLLIEGAEDGQVRAVEAIERGGLVPVEGDELPIPVGMVLAAAGQAWWLLVGEAEEEGRDPSGVRLV